MITTPGPFSICSKPWIGLYTLSLNCGCLGLVHSKMKQTEILLNVYFSLENSQLILLLEYLHKVNDTLIRMDYIIKCGAQI